MLGLAFDPDPEKFRGLGEVCFLGKAQTRRAIQGIVRRVVANFIVWLRRDQAPV